MIDTLCEMSKLHSDVCDFINVCSPREDSITDFIVWKLRRFLLGFYETSYINIEEFVRTMSRREEAINGADLEIVFTYNGYSLHFLFQAKKLIDTNMNYCNAIRRSRSSQGSQIERLISHASQEGKIPFYLFYSDMDYRINVMCRGYCKDSLTCSCILMTSAYCVLDRFNSNCNTHNGRLLKYDLVNDCSNPFLCLFCCPLTRMSNPSPLEHILYYIKEYYPDFKVNINERIPAYVNDIIEGILQNRLENLIIKASKSEKKESEFLWKDVLNMLKNYRLLSTIEQDNEEIWIVKRVLVINMSARSHS